MEKAAACTRSAGTRLLVPLVLLALFVGECWASMELPERARGGKAWQIQQSRLQGYRGGMGEADNFTAFTWDAWVDNFDESAGTFKQRYYVDDRFYDEKQGVVFLMIGGEGTLEAPPQGYIKDLGEKYGAWLVSLEHRFYGESLPNNDKSTSNYRYLTVEQALADLNRFTSYVKTDLLKRQDLRFFAFGGSYPGALAAWYRVAYPDATLGTLSSSGVVNAILRFPEFDEHVALAVGETCADLLRRTTRAFEEALPTKGKEVKALFGVDEGMWDPDFFYMLADSAAMADQYGHKAELCQALQSIGPQPSDARLVVAFANFTNHHYGPQFGSSCFYDTRCLADADTATLNERSWRWAKCFQLAYLQVAPETGSLRSSLVDLPYTLDQCQRIFGLDNKPAVDDINHLYGGDQPAVSRVFFSDFSDDPWMCASVLKELGPDRPYELVTCDGCGHCMDLHAPQPDDPEPLRAARTRFESYLAQWLGSPPPPAMEA